MNQRYPEQAYEAIPYGPMAGGTDLGFDHVRNRFDEVFGPHGFGWRMEPHPAFGRIDTASGEKQHTVTMINYVLEYRVVLGDGAMSWERLSPLSDSDTNKDLGYAYRGCFTSLLKQALRALGGLNHIYADSKLKKAS